MKPQSVVTAGATGALILAASAAAEVAFKVRVVTSNKRTRQERGTTARGQQGWR
jgi:hypothetical protein